MKSFGMVRTRAAVLLLSSLAAYCFAVPAARAITATWQSSGLDLWFYTNAISAGGRVISPTFLGPAVVNETTMQFDPLPASEPARLGTMLVAFDTSLFIEAGLAANRYQINSVTVQATWSYEGSSSTLYYQNTPITQGEVLAEYASGNVTSQRPMELYGVGFRNGYTGYEFDGATSGPPLMDEITHPYTSGSYNAYPLVGDGSLPGQYVDVTNSVTGGFSATAPGNTTTPFTPTPWAIGTTGLANGAAIPDNTTFTFPIDLNGTGVRSYIQQSLADGGLGFFISTLHATSEFGVGGGYPRWYTKEATGFPYNVPAGWLPQLVIDYTILPPGVPGDYNNNGAVDAADYVLWRKGGPLQNEVDNPGIVNAQDYVEWRARFGNTSGSGSAFMGTASVPEPRLGAAFVLVGILLASWQRMITWKVQG